MKRIIERLIEGCIILGILWLVGCATVKGIAHDVSWAADKVDSAIVVPE